MLHKILKVGFPCYSLAKECWALTLRMLCSTEESNQVPGDVSETVLTNKIVKLEKPDIPYPGSLTTSVCDLKKKQQTAVPQRGMKLWNINPMRDPCGKLYHMPKESCKPLQFDEFNASSTGPIPIQQSCAGDLIQDY